MQVTSYALAFRFLSIDDAPEEFSFERLSFLCFFKAGSL